VIANSEPTIRSKAENKKLGRYLGAAYLTVLVGSAVSGALWPALSDGISADKLLDTTDNLAMLRWSAVIELFITSVGIVVLASLLYIVLSRHNRNLSLVALGCWWAEATTLAVSTVGAFLLIPVSEAYAQASGAEATSLLALGDALARLDRLTWEIHMVFFAIGGLIWYTVMYRSRVVPRWLSLAGLVVVALGMVSTVLLFVADVDLFYLGIPTGVFELVLGVWLVTKGLSSPEKSVSV
jgi:hypothetical protein